MKTDSASAMRVWLLLAVAFVAFTVSACCDSLEEGLKSELDVENKPGMKELREAGCTAAVELLGRVQCTVPPESELDCEKVAKAYAGAISPAPEEIKLSVMAMSDKTEPEVRCEGVYSADGKKLRELENKTTIQKRKTTTTLD